MQADSMIMGEDDAPKKPTSISHNPLEPFLLLVKGTKGAACMDLIKTVLEAPGVYVFSELLSHPNVLEVCVTIRFFLSHLAFRKYLL